MYISPGFRKDQALFETLACEKRKNVVLGSINAIATALLNNEKEKALDPQQIASLQLDKGLLEKEFSYLEAKSNYYGYVLDVAQQQIKAIEEQSKKQQNGKVSKGEAVINSNDITDKPVEA